MGHAVSAAQPRPKGSVVTSVAVIGAGITGVTTAYKLMKQGLDVTVFDRNPYAAMETSFANGGQLSASNAEVWNSPSTFIKGVKWMLKKDAPCLLYTSPSPRDRQKSRMPSSA